MEYEDFFVQIGPSVHGAFAVSVRSPAGEGSGRFEIPFCLRELSCMAAADAEQPASRHLSIQQDLPMLTPAGAGADLFSALLTGELLALFHESLSLAQASGRGLRIRLRLDLKERGSAPLHGLPWELLCRPDTGDFLALSRSTPVVRFLDAHRPVPRVRRPPRLRILAVVSVPSDLPALEVEEEMGDLEAAWEGQEVVRLARASREDLREALLAGPFHVLHFLGHGAFAEDGGKLFFERPSGEAQGVGGGALAIELKDFKDLRLIVLNACESASTAQTGADPMAGIASALVLGGIPAVVAMRSPIFDRAALAFARALSERLAAGDPVDAAVVEGRLAIHRLDEVSEEWATPVLFLRSSDGRLFPEAPPAPQLRRGRLAAAFLGLSAAFLLLWLALAWERPAVSPKALAHNNQGVALAADGRDAEAREAFLAALAIDPRYGAALSNLSAVEERGGDLDAALRHAREAVANGPDDAVLHFNLGNLLSRLGREEEALASLGRAVELEPSYAEARNELASVYLRLERPGDARRELLAGLRVRPDLAPLHKNLARAALAEGRNREAIGHLERALAFYGVTDPKGSAEATYWLAVALAAEGRSAEACRRLRGLTRAQPSGVAAWTSDAVRLARQERCGP